MADLRRNPAVDALRVLAILGMMAAHTSRLIALESRQAWSHWILLLEPVIPSLFLFLVGISLTYSLARAENPRAWYFRQARRAMGLWLISALFFALEDGIRLPDIFIASGILCTIAYSILSLGAVLLLSQRVLVLSLLTGFGLLAFALLDRSGVNTFPFISGNSPLFPLWLFAAAGTLWGFAMRRSPRIIPWIGFSAMAFAVWAISRYGWEPLFTHPLGRSDATRVLAAPFFGGGNVKRVAYYNIRPLLSLLCLSLHLGVLWLTLAVLSRVKEARTRGFLILGRHSLEVYVLHLFLLAMLVVSFGLRPLKTAWQGNAVLMGVAVICFGWAFLREKFDMGRFRLFSTRKVAK